MRPKHSGFIILTPGVRCKCSCRKHTGSDGKDYWVDTRASVVYISDCHLKNPIKAKGKFQMTQTKYIYQ